MKDATGELSMTAVAVVAIAAIALLFSTVIWPTIRTNIMRSTYCASAFNCQSCSGGMCNCQYCPEDSGDANSVGIGCTSPAAIQCSENSR